VTACEVSGQLYYVAPFKPITIAYLLRTCLIADTKTRAIPPITVECRVTEDII